WVAPIAGNAVEAAGGLSSLLRSVQKVIGTDCQMLAFERWVAPIEKGGWHRLWATPQTGGFWRRYR
ncbi:MAG: hypothetical protein ACK44Q_10280, partial [Pirellulaceae bacterium]